MADNPIIRYLPSGWTEEKYHNANDHDANDEDYEALTEEYVSP